MHQYIRDHAMQDPTNKRRILADAALGKLLNSISRAHKPVVLCVLMDLR